MGFRRTGAQALSAKGAFLLFVDSDGACGVELPGATLLTCNYPLHPSFFGKLLDRMGAKPALSHAWKHGGVLMTSVANRAGERFLCIINLDDVSKSLLIEEHGKALFEGKRVVRLVERPRCYHSAFATAR